MGIQQFHASNGEIVNILKKKKRKDWRQPPTQCGSTSPPAGEADSTLLEHLESCKQSREATNSPFNKHLSPLSTRQATRMQHHLEAQCTSLGCRGGFSERRLGQRAKVRADFWLNTSCQHQAEVNHTFSVWCSINKVVFQIATWCWREHCVQFLYSRFQKKSVRYGEFR